MPSWRDSFPGSPVVNFDLDDGSSIPVLRENARRMGFVDQLQEMAAGAPPPPPAPEQPPMPTLPGVGAVPVTPGVLPQTPAPAPAPVSAQSPAPAPAAPAAAKRPAPAASVNVEQELRDSDVTAPDFAPDAVSGGSLPVEQPQAPQVAGDTTGGGVDLDARNRAAADPSQVTRPSVSVTGGVSGAGERAGGPMSQEEVDQRAAEERMRAVESTNLAMATLEEKRRAAMEKLDRDYAALQKDLGDSIKKAADHKIKNPIDQWGTGRKIGAVLMAVIGGIGSALKRQGDKNPALDLIMAHVDQSIALQMADRDKLGQDVTRKRQQIADYDGLLTNRNAKFHAERAALLEAEARKIMAVGAKAANESVRFEYEAMANAMLAQAQKDAEAAAQQEFKNGIDLAKASADIAKTEAEIAKLGAETRKLQGGGGGGGGLAGKTGTVGRYQTLDQIDPKYREKAVRLPDGSWAITNSREAAKDGTAIMADSRVMVQNIDRALEKVASETDGLTKIKDRTFWQSEQGAIVKQELSQLLLNGKQFYKLGALSENDAAIIERLGANQKEVDYFVNNLWPKLSNWRDGITQDAVVQLQARGIDVAADEAYGAAPQKAKAKRVDDWVAEVTARPTFDGDEIVAGPNLDDSRKALRAIRDAASNEGMSEADWNSTIRTLKQETRRNKMAMRERLDAINEALDGGKKGKDAKGDPWAPSSKVKVTGDRASLVKQKAFVAAQLVTYDKIDQEIEAMKADDRAVAKKRADKAKAEKSRDERIGSDTRQGFTGPATPSGWGGPKDYNPGFGGR